jgi:hypothetical protein
MKIVDMGDPERKILYRKKISTNGLYEIDLTRFMMTKHPRHFELYKDMRKIAGSRADFKNCNLFKDANSDSEDSEDDEDNPPAPTHTHNVLHTCYTAITYLKTAQLKKIQTQKYSKM